MAKHRRAYPSVDAWKKATGTTQAQLAERLGISQPHLSNVLSKTRKASLDVAWRISQVTNVPIENIVDLPADYGVSKQ